MSGPGRVALPWRIPLGCRHHALSASSSTKTGGPGQARAIAGAFLPAERLMPRRQLCRVPWAGRQGTVNGALHHGMRVIVRSTPQDMAAQGVAEREVSWDEPTAPRKPPTQLADVEQVEPMGRLGA